MADDGRVRELFAAHGAALHGYVVRRAGPGTDPADVVASVLEVAWRRLNRVPAGPAARPYLFGVARKVLANAERGRRRQLRLVERLAAYAVPAGAEEDPGVERVRAAMARLAPLDREALAVVWQARPQLALLIETAPPAGTKADLLAFVAAARER